MHIAFNPGAYQPYTGPELLQAGDYPVIIEDVAAERAKDPASGLLKITFAVQNGHPNAGRKIFYRLNIWNVSETSKATAHKQLTSLCYATGIMGELSDTDMLKGRGCVIELTNDGTYNNVKIVKDMAGNIPGKSPVQAGGAGGPQFGSAPAPGQQGPGPGFVPAGAAPGGFNPGASPTGGAPNPFAPQGGAPPPQQFQQPAPQADPYAGWVRQNGYRQNPQTGQWEPDAPPQQYQQPVQGTPAPFGAPGPQGGAPAGFVQPNAQQPFNPGANFTPGGGQQTQAPAGWPQQ